MKRQMVFVWVIGGLVLAGCQSNVKKNSSTESLTKESSVTISETVVSTSESKVVDKAETKAIDIAGEVYASGGELCDELAGDTSGLYFGNGDGKADGYSNFIITIQYVSASDMTIKMSDGVASHEMTFSKQNQLVMQRMM
ncbi:MAG: hypothetical protein ACLUQ0_11240 [Enterococcus italicus]|uniref:hypothetical protein n=1 Tax=Enterococcus italicus TaxID=246144 RepID=UPI0039945093